MDAAIIFGGLIIVIAIWFFLVVIPLHDAAGSVPLEYQLMTPSSVFFLFIPLVNLVWIFFVVIRISNSFQDYFRDKKVTKHGSCGFAVGLAWAIGFVLSITNHYISHLAGLAGLVCMIIYLVTVSGCKRTARSLVLDDDLTEAHASPAAFPPLNTDPRLPSLQTDDSKLPSPHDN